jgi:hypothetical protein
VPGAPFGWGTAGGSRRFTVARRNSPARPLALALACGVDYGVAAFVVKLMTADFSGGLPQLFGHWPIYALAVVGPLGFLINENAF